jgi:ribosome-associated protein
MAKSDTHRGSGAGGHKPSLPDEVRAAARAAFDKKAQHVTVLDLRKAPAFTDFFLICTGQTGRQVKAIVEAIDAALGKAGVHPSHIEGGRGAEWVLMDFFDFIVHVFTPDTREFYALERLWGSADRLEFTDSDLP